MKLTHGLVPVAFLGLALAGCIDGPTVDDALIPGLQPLERFTGLVMAGENCETSVGVSGVGPMFNQGPLMGLWGDNVGPFKIKDIREITGIQVAGITGMVFVAPPDSGPPTAVWHGMSRCDSYTLPDGTVHENWQQGWIAAYIEPPEWGADGIDHHFFVADLAFSDVGLVQEVLEGTSLGLELNQAVSAEIGWPYAQVQHAYLHDAMHGLFEWQAPQRPALPRETTTIRYWTLVHESNTVPPTHFDVNTHGFRDANVAEPEHENEGNGEIEGRYYPVVFDLVHENAGDSVAMLAAESTGTFSHTEYCHHGHPESATMHGHDGESTCEDPPEKFAADETQDWQGGQTEAGLYWGGYNQKITMGPDYSDRWFDVTWIH